MGQIRLGSALSPRKGVLPLYLRCAPVGPCTRTLGGLLPAPGWVSSASSHHVPGSAGQGAAGHACLRQNSAYETEKKSLQPEPLHAAPGAVASLSPADMPRRSLLSTQKLCCKRKSSAQGLEAKVPACPLCPCPVGQLHRLRDKFLLLPSQPPARPWYSSSLSLSAHLQEGQRPSGHWGFAPLTASVHSRVPGDSASALSVGTQCVSRVPCVVLLTQMYSLFAFI